MKKAIYLIIALIGLSAPSCSDSMLDFSPTDSGSGKELLKSASTAITSVNGVYRSMWTAGWSTTANTHQCFGIAAYNLALDCMADDLIMQSQGNGWFWGDHCYNFKSNDTSSAFRSYDCLLDTSGPPTALRATKAARGPRWPAPTCREPARWPSAITTALKNARALRAKCSGRRC